MRLPIVLLLSVATAACGSSEGNNAAGPNQTGANPSAGNQAAAAAPADGNAAASGPLAMAGGDRLQAGQWEMTGMVRSLDAPGAPPEQRAALQRQVGRPMANRTCLTEEQARDFGRFANSGLPGRGCTMSDRVYAGGVIRLSMSCPLPGGRPGAIRMSVQGRYTPTSLELAMNQELPGPVRGGVSRGGAPPGGTVSTGQLTR